MGSGAVIGEYRSRDGWSGDYHGSVVVNLFLTDIFYDPRLERRLSSIRMSGDSYSVEQRCLEQRLSCS